MAKPALKKPKTYKYEPAVKKAPLTLQGQVEKWFLPVLFVLIGGVLVWTFVHGYMHPPTS
jgi:cytochrome c-type biogenesis protein CcmH/NrfF